MIRRLRTLGRVLTSPAAIPRLLSSGGRLDHKPCRIGIAIIIQINQSLRGTGGTLVAFSELTANSARSSTPIG